MPSSSPALYAPTAIPAVTSTTRIAATIAHPRRISCLLPNAPRPSPPSLAPRCEAAVKAFGRVRAHGIEADPERGHPSTYAKGRAPRTEPGLLGASTRVGPPVASDDGLPPPTGDLPSPRASPRPIDPPCPAGSEPPPPTGDLPSLAASPRPTRVGQRGPAPRADGLPSPPASARPRTGSPRAW